MSQLYTSNWSETAANNTAATPNGWPEGQNPDTVNDCAREIMSALKINFNHVHGLDGSGALVSSGGTSSAYTLTYSTAPATLYTGFLFGFKVNATCVAAPTLNVNGLGAKNIQKNGPSGLANLAAGNMHLNSFALCRYDATLDKFILLNPKESLAGSWTCQLLFGGGQVGMSPTSVPGQYTVIGDMCFIQIAYALTARGSSTGAATFTLPFAPAVGLGPVPLGGFYDSLLVYSGRPVPFVQESDGLLSLFTFTSGAGAGLLDHNAFINLPTVIISGHYRI